MNLSPRPSLLPIVAAAALLVLSACADRVDRDAAPPSEPIDNTAAQQATGRLEADDTASISQPAPPPAPIMEERVRQAAAKSELQEIQVTASRRDKRLQDVPVRIQMLGTGVAAPSIVADVADVENEQYADIVTNTIQRAAEQPVSTFSIDVDTGSYANVRRWLSNGNLPPADAVRVEELVNYFDYGYAAPKSKAVPFAVHTEIAPTPWNEDTRLLRIGLQGWMPDAEPKAANLVFLVDVSGSMQDPDKLGLAQQALRLLTRELGPDDRISLVVYAGSSGVVLEPTAGDHKADILRAIDGLQASGGTNGAAGITTAYRLARDAWIDGGINRVILATDGDFNVGVTDFDLLLELARKGRKDGVALTTLGFGEGNYNDQLMEQLADAGDGNHAYIDSLAEAQKVLVRQRAGTLDTIARDVKIQIEFNPAVVAEYRLIGYENRMLEREDFNNDAVDAGDIGAGHNVTALYEVALVGGKGKSMDPLRYAEQAREVTPKASDELAFLKLRYKRPGESSSRLIEQPLKVADIEDSAHTSAGFRLAAAVAAYGQLLRGTPYVGSYSFDDARALAASARGQDPYGDTGEFLKLAQLAGGLSAHTVGSAED